MTAVTPDVVRAPRDAGSSLTSPLSGITIPRFHGAAARLLAAERHNDPHTIFSATPLPTCDRP
ncbi:hypothetical protein ACFXKC_38855 [Streptomyces sp. NPDC059340]|uniref:hypothetical protein n=1 Tax=Streptomyces sp. NPDC059340 TaxID=3346806 RepID=UPI0036802A5E